MCFVTCGWAGRSRRERRLQRKFFGRFSKVGGTRTDRLRQSATAGERFGRRWFRFGGKSPEKPSLKGRGRLPDKKRPQDGWKYLQVIKERDEKDRVTGTEKKAIFGEEEPLLEIFEEHTAYVERTHLPALRQMNSRLVRKGLGFSKELPTCRAASRWEDAICNLTRRHKSLRIDLTGPPDGQPGRRWKKQTPAMAAGLTDQAWSTKKVLRTVPTTNTQSAHYPRSGRVAKGV